MIPSSTITASEAREIMNTKGAEHKDRIVKKAVKVCSRKIRRSAAKGYVGINYARLPSKYEPWLVHIFEELRSLGFIVQQNQRIDSEVGIRINWSEQPEE